MQRLIHQAQLLLEERPIWTRRALRNRLSEDDWNIIGSNAARYIYQHVGYLWASGPWRDAIVRFGIDPRKDPEYRIYQTMMFVIEPVPRKPNASGTQSNGFNTTKPRSRESHFFDGKSITLDGKVWQVCHITDPQLASILSTSNLRSECHVSLLNLLTSKCILWILTHSPFFLGLRGWLVPQRHVGKSENDYEIETEIHTRWSNSQ